MFDKIETKPLKYKVSSLPTLPSKEYTLPALTAGIQNQGLNCYVSEENSTILDNVITISANGANTGATFFQKNKFTVLQDAYAIKWKDTTKKISENQYLYLVSSIRKTIYGNFEWTNKAGWAKVKNENIKLPLKSGEIDFDFMEAFIKNLKGIHISRIQEYLIENGLDDHKLTTEEKDALISYKNGMTSMDMYPVQEFFNVLTPKKRYDANKVKILERGYPYVVRTSMNNGIRGYISEDEQYLNDGNTISFGQDTATVFYQNKPYFTGDKIKILYPKDIFNAKIGLFFITSITKAFSTFSWGGSSYNVDVIKEQPISIPTKDGKPDYRTMELIGSGLQKLTIKDVLHLFNLV